MVDMLSFDADDAGYVTELADYVAVPSVSRDAARETMLAAADWLVANASSYGITQVSYGGYQWTAGLGETSWQAEPGPTPGRIVAS